MISFEEFLRVDIRVGKIVSAEHFVMAKNPAYILKIDFGGEIGIRKSSAQVTVNYALADLPGKLVLAVVNFPRKQIGPIMSEVLVLGGVEKDGTVRLLKPDPNCELGSRVG